MSLLNANVHFRKFLGICSDFELLIETEGADLTVSQDYQLLNQFIVLLFGCSIKARAK